MIYAGTDLKYRITSTIESFSFADNDFTITIKNRWGKVLYEITKEDCLVGSDDNYYFCMENVPAGVLYAHFNGGINDDDYDKAFRSITDTQHLVTVGSCDCGMCECECCQDHKVQYEQVWTVNVDDGEYLADCEGNFIYTSDGCKIAFKKNNQR